MLWEYCREIEGRCQEKYKRSIKKFPQGAKKSLQKGERGFCRDYKKIPTGRKIPTGNKMEG